MRFTLKGKSVLLLISGLFLLSSCATRYKNALFTAPSDAVMDTLKTVYVANNNGPEDVFYKIKAGDQIAIRNLQDVEFGAQQASTASAASGQSGASSYLVESSGEANLPVIGKVHLAGLTRSEARLKLQDLYSKSLLKDPIIELSIVNLKVTLLGEFNTQGNFLIEKDNTSLIEILGQAGGLTEEAEAKSIKILRGDRSKPEIIYINLKDVNSLSHPKLTLQNNDIVYAEPRKEFSSREKFQRVMTYVQPLILILNTAVIIYNLSR